VTFVRTDDGRWANVRGEEWVVVPNGPGDETGAARLVDAMMKAARAGSSRQALMFAGLLVECPHDPEVGLWVGR
jgi:hypothetical protein